MEFKNADWIWLDGKSDGDVYGEFFDSFDYAGGNVRIGVSCVGNYALYVNGELTEFGQYADFPWHKVYDEYDVTDLMRKGKNELKILVWYCGDDGSFGFYNTEPGLIYEVCSGGKIVARSSAKTPCRPAPDYVPGLKKLITPQLGYSFRYDTRTRTDAPTRPAFCTGRRAKPFPRPVRRLTLEPLTVGKLIDKDKRLYDLGRERAGYLFIRFKAAAGDTLSVRYGEHIADGGVRSKIQNRDFSVELIGNGETVEYFNPFRRLGCRYLQIDAAGPVIIEEIGLRERLYPLTERPFDAGNGLRRRIYDTAVRTLRLCMHEHYEDTPWREQGLYGLDSRNQMLFGGAAFADGLEFQRASLELMALDRRPDGLLTICTPSSADLAIPSFSLWFIVAVREYAERADDFNFAGQYFQKLSSVIKVFTDRTEDGLVRNFQGEKTRWDFYEWNDGLDGVNGEYSVGGTVKFDAALQFICSLALQSMSVICENLGKAERAKTYASLAADITAAANKRFWRQNRGLYDTFGDGKHYSELVNALAVLSGAADGERAKAVCSALAAGKNFVKSTLSMRSFTYDALIKTDRAFYAEFILGDMDTLFGKMLSAGATSFWETEKGEADFDGAGSLCHGWSALPAYYYRLLLGQL
ncbi:MAG: family 78 glycoside hydrolase catalytic domain [Clostridiales bacterium]|jgi:hypothetical protein|nr:family 78 glycoside hydrolase catalytic domain [Clostridiales bacterium]